MLLCIDTGNTQTVIGLFDGGALADHWRIATVADRTADELALMIQQFLGFHGFHSVNENMLPRTKAFPFKFLNALLSDFFLSSFEGNKLGFV